MTSSRFGTFGSDSAPVEETMRFSSMSTPGMLRDLGAGGDDDLLGLHRLLLAVDEGDLDLAGPEDAAGAVELIDLVLLEQERDAFDIALHASSLKASMAGRSSSGFDLDAHGGEVVAGFGVGLAGMQQRLGGDAADIEAGAAMGGALLDDCDLHSQVAPRGWRRHSRRARCR